MQWMDDAGVDQHGRRDGHEAIFLLACDGQPAKTRSTCFAACSTCFGTGLSYVLVRNQVRGADFAALEQSGEQARAIGMGAKIVSMKKLNEHVIHKIDAASSSFWQAKTSDRDSTGLGLMDRQRVKMWLRDVYREIDDVGV